MIILSSAKKKIEKKMSSNADIFNTQMSQTYTMNLLLIQFYCCRVFNFELRKQKTNARLSDGDSPPDKRRSRGPRGPRRRRRAGACHGPTMAGAVPLSDQRKREGRGSTGCFVSLVLEISIVLVFGYLSLYKIWRD